MSFWADKHVLITGADGFLGANLTKLLIAQGAYVVTLSRKGIHPRSLLHIEGLDSQVARKEVGSVEDFGKLSQIIKNHSITVIYHLAALPLVEIGQSNPTQTFEVNIRGTWNVLEAARENNVDKIVPVSTSHVYGDNPNLPYEEAFYPQPSRPYETSKACADLLAQSYADTYGLGVEIPRLVNVYGPGDLNMGRLVPKVIKTVLMGRNPILWESGAVRDFLFVDDAVRALLLLVEKNLFNKKRNRIFNFGSGQPVDVLDLARKIVELANVQTCKVEVEPMPQGREREILQQYVSIEKAKQELGWTPEVNLEDGLRQTIEWYKKHTELLLSTP